MYAFSCSSLEAFSRDRRRRGGSMIEFCLLLPWYIFLFVGAFDFGFYAYSLISTGERGPEWAQLIAQPAPGHARPATTQRPAPTT